VLGNALRAFADFLVISNQYVFQFGNDGLKFDGVSFFCRQAAESAEVGEVKHWNPLSLAEGLIWDAKWSWEKGMATPRTCPVIVTWHHRTVGVAYRPLCLFASLTLFAMASVRSSSGPRIRFTRADLQRELALLVLSRSVLVPGLLVADLRMWVPCVCARAHVNPCQINLASAAETSSSLTSGSSDCGQE